VLDGTLKLEYATAPFGANPGDNATIDETATAALAPRQMHQVAPWPDELVLLVNALRYRLHLGWKVTLESDLERDHEDVHQGESRGLTLVVERKGPNSYDHAEMMEVAHYFAVPPATYNRASWMRWLFDRLGDVDDHERMEDFTLDVSALGAEGAAEGELVRPYAPNHGPGWDPYLVTVERTALDRQTSFRGEVNP